jgi:RNA polymerase sigma-70 factor (ECF subfamily)
MNRKLHPTDKKRQNERMKIYTDTQLIELIRSSDKEAFDQLYQRYWRLLYGLVAQKTGEPSEAEDMVQEIFIDIWNKRSRLEITHTIKAYLISCAYYKIFRYFRDKGLREKQLEDFARFLERTGESIAGIDLSSAVFETEFGKLQDVIKSTIQLMPEQMQKVTLLRYRQMKTIPEIAGELNISPLTVKKHLQIAMSRLRQNAGQHATGSTALLVCLWITQTSQ